LVYLSDFCFDSGRTFIVSTWKLNMSALSVDPDKPDSVAILFRETWAANPETTRNLLALSRGSRIAAQESGITQLKPRRAFYGMTADVVHKFDCLFDYFYKNKYS